MIMLNLSIEQIFSVKNVDQDCTLIAGLMTPFQNQISSASSFSDNVPAGRSEDASWRLAGNCEFGGYSTLWISEYGTMVEK